MSALTKSLPTFENTQIAFQTRDNAELKRMYWLFSMMNSNFLVSVGTKFLQFSFKAGLPVTGIVKSTIFAHFCGGESIQDCEKTVKKLSKYNIGTILDYSVEGEINEASFDATEAETIATVKRAAGSAEIPFSVFKMTGLADIALLEKIQSENQLSVEEIAAWERVKKRVDNVCKTAHDLNVRLFIDAEETWTQKPIDELVIAMMLKYNQKSAIVYNTYQMYCHSKLAQIRTDFNYVTENGCYFGAKLVRGAYMEKERERAEALGYQDPIQPDKASTDRDFDLAVRFCVENHERAALCAGTHNENSSQLLAELLHTFNIDKKNPNFYFAQLFGMSDHISYNLSAEGYNVAKYVPYGPVKSVMPYLMRRAEENTAIAGQSGREFNLIKKETVRRKNGNS